MASTRTFVFLSAICILGGVGLLFFHGRRKRRGEHTVKWLFYSCVCFALHFATGLLAITMFHVRFVYPCMSQISPCTRKYGTGYFSCMGSLPLSLLSAVLVALKIRKYKRWILLRKNFLAGL
ncbi:MAG: uncharacterized protein A8A55_1747 [Amphiamblys sp. WSBS2006]|nr:MAG: uncharacterized protein A8A55_1747 [Amphiamblys sp. WSBS2006]